MYAKALTDVGLVRKDNEDNYLVSAKRGLFVVADGMGGHVGGQLASTLAIQVLDREIPKTSANPDVLLQNALIKANEVIWQHGQARGYSGMGTTLTAAMFADQRLYIAHIGDSRAYLYRDGRITQLTEDHSLVNELVQSGGITHAEAENHPQRNILTRALGSNAQSLIDEFSLPVISGDYLLLSTDGLHNHVSSEELRFLLSQPVTLKEKVGQLVNTALARGGTDNVTVVLVQYE